MQRIFVVGRLTKDPELKTTNSGKEVCKFTVAEDGRKNKDGEKKTTFFRCEAWNAAAALINTYFHKGDGIIVVGRHECDRGTDKDGSKRDYWTLKTEDIVFPPGKGKGGQNDSSNAFSDEVDANAGDLPF